MGLLDVFLHEFGFEQEMAKRMAQKNYYSRILAMALMVGCLVLSNDFVNDSLTAHQKADGKLVWAAKPANTLKCQMELLEDADKFCQGHMDGDVCQRDLEADSAGEMSNAQKECSGILEDMMGARFCQYESYAIVAMLGVASALQIVGLGRAFGAYFRGKASPFKMLAILDMLSSVCLVSAAIAYLVLCVYNSNQFPWANSGLMMRMLRGAVVFGIPIFLFSHLVKSDKSLSRHAVSMQIAKENRERQRHEDQEEERP